MQNKAGLCSVSFAHLRLWFLKSTVELLAPRQKEKKRNHTDVAAKPLGVLIGAEGPLFVCFFFRSGTTFFKKCAK